MSKAKTPKGVPVKGQRIAMVTGATSGIGEATAELFCKRGIAVIVCGRRVERLRASSRSAWRGGPRCTP